jgi:LPXTG-motif cell wall-anchored protein
VEQGILEPQIPTYSTERQRKVGDFKFVIIKEQPADLIVNDKLSSLDRRLIGGRIYLQKITASPISWYGLEFSNVIEESSPINPSQPTTPTKPVQAGQAAATNFVDQRLPQTGETDQQHMTLSGLLLLAMSSLLGLFGMTKRQRKE